MGKDQQAKGEETPSEIIETHGGETVEAGEPPADLPIDDSALPAPTRPAQTAHGWRWFAVEYTVVALGVLTALGLDQAVEDYHARSELAETRAVIELDLRQATASEAMVERSTQCRERQFAVLAAAVGKGDLARANELMGKARIFSALPVSDAVWTTALASGVTYGLSPEERNSYNGAYFLARQQSDFQVEFFRSQARFEGLVGSELSASPDAPGRALGELVEMQAIAANSRGVMMELRRNAENVLGKADIEPEAWQIAFVAECEAAADAMNGTEPAT
ncbi:hypothetical protein GRI89_07795 [Altererythrobacter salegens]|uniref:Uncharacterized protein n=1 Tax=Croceibacterium salegens TaxID=1737568 RepID=A0A6I4SYU5_9SPHN|nr:hypothetical protein [Croceibacterium salegens]MXO59442.1 hypothetical protein [Croceibacterium salegens]